MIHRAEFLKVTAFETSGKNALSNHEKAGRNLKYMLLREQIPGDSEGQGSLAHYALQMDSLPAEPQETSTKNINLSTLKIILIYSGAICNFVLFKKKKKD